MARPRKELPAGRLDRVRQLASEGYRVIDIARAVRVPPLVRQSTRRIRRRAEVASRTAAGSMPYAVIAFGLFVGFGLVDVAKGGMAPTTRLHKSSRSSSSEPRD